MANPIIREFLSERGAPSARIERRREFVRDLLAEIRARCRNSPDLFDDVGWAILFDIYDMSLAGRGSKLQDLGIGYPHSNETIMRFVLALEARGLVRIYEGSYERLCVELTKLAVRRLNDFIDKQYDRSIAKFG